MSRTLFVNQSATSIQPDGSIQNPFLTIQGAVDFAATLTPTASDPVAIAVMQGTYAENVVIDIDGIALRGLGGVGTVRIQPPSGPAVTITNCTPASVQSFAVSKDAAVLQDNGKSVAPVRVELVDLALQSVDPAAPTLCIVGFPKRAPLGVAPNAITLSNCLIHHSDIVTGKALFAYFADLVRARHNCEITAPTEIFNCFAFLVDDASVQDFVIDFDPAAAPAPPPTPTSMQFGLVCDNATFVGNTTEIRGSAGTTIQPTLNTTFSQLVVRETAKLSMIGGAAYSVTAEGKAYWQADGVQVIKDIVGRDSARLNTTGVQVGGHVLGDGAATLDLMDVHVRGNLRALSTAKVKMIGGGASSVRTAGGASWIADGVHVRGALTIEPGPGPVTMNGGRYMGALTDPSAKLVRNLGN